MRIYIKTYGCQMNERDSEALAGALEKHGHRMVAREDEADVLIFNTCSVREQAERKAVGKIGFMKKLKLRNPDLMIGVIGCMAQNRGAALFETLPHLDFVLGTGQLHKLPELVESLRAERRQLAETAMSPEVLTSLDEHSAAERYTPFQASIAITRGCNRFCSYCIVPYVRGREISREAADILAEAQRLADDGVREILLLGQNVAAYGLNGNIDPPAPEHSPFAELLESLCRIDGIARIRFTSPYPSYFNRRLIETIERNPKICRNIHLPLQSGSARILAAMNRQYSPDSYWEIVREIQRRMPELTFSTDVIVGFPGETDEDFGQTRELMERVGFDQAYIFKYSPRPGTKSGELADSVPQAVKEERNQLLLGDLERRTLARNRSLIGQTLEVLIEGPSARNMERWSGKTSTGKTVIFFPEPGMQPGGLAMVPIHFATAMSLFGPGVRD